MTARRDRLEVFVATKGHAFSRDAFEAMLRAEAIEPTFVDHPAASILMTPDGLRGYDAILLYDMPGMDFRAPRADRPSAIPPPAALMEGFEGLLAQGKGIVALHHAIAGWPAWPDYAEALGGAFLYRPTTIRGVMRPSSEFRAETRYEVVKAGDHPILDDVPDRFELVDEPYAFEVFDDSIHPLLVRASSFPADGFVSACDAVRRAPEGERSASTRPTVSAVIGWVKVAGNSPVVYLQPGDGPATYAHPAYRRIVGNALRWVASSGAQEWARGHDGPGPAVPRGA